MKVSVALAAYNGEKFIEAQLSSILSQLPPDGEIVVSLDPSRDATAGIVSRIASTDPRVKLIAGQGHGLIANFENAIRASSGDVIFTCDQDDVWLPGKIEKMTAAFDEPSVLAVLHDARVTDGDLNTLEDSFFAAHGRRKGPFANWLRNSYIGCCMAFRRELCDAILPFPDRLPMHDQWIGIIAERAGKTADVNEPLILWRRHGDNSSSTTHASFGRMLRWRLDLAAALCRRAPAVRALKKKVRAAR